LNHKNLTLISRSSKALEGLPLADFPTNLGIVSHLTVGQAPGKSDDHPPFAIARNVDGELLAWGDNQHQQLELPDAVRSMARTGDLVSLSAGAHHALALDRSGKVVAWGSNELGQSEVPKILSPVTQIQAGPYFSVALLEDGSVRVWGGSEEMAAPATLRAVKQIATGDHSILALHPDATITAWGTDPGTSRHTSQATDVVDIACVGEQNFALLGDGQLLGWNNGPAKRPLPKLTATAIRSARDILAIQLRSGGWIFYGKNPDKTPTSPPINRRHLNAAASSDLIFSWVYEDRDTGSDLTGINGKSAGTTLPATAQTALDEAQQRLEELYLERVEIPYQESVTSLEAYYLQYLEADAAIAQTNAQLDTLVAIQAEQERMKNGEPVPLEDDVGTPVALANRRAIYRHTLQSYEATRIAAEAELNQLYIEKLDLMQADFTREGDTESALALRGYRDSFAATHTTPAELDGTIETAEP
jgi:hypothetical protein